MFSCLILHQRNAERSGTEMFSCLILHQRNSERSGTEMEERSRECIFYISVTRSGAEQRWKKGPGNVPIVKCSTMFSCLILHQRNTERSGTEMEERSGNIFQCSVALFYISVTLSGAERRWKKGPGNVSIVKCSTMFSCLILHKRNSERSGTEMEERSRKCSHCKMFYNVQLPYSTSA